MSDETFKTSDMTTELDAALAKAQAKVQAALKEKENSHFKSKYADLSAIWEACREALTQHGLSVTQWPVHSEDNRLHLVTRLAHASGQWLLARCSMPVVKQDPHGYGSATTYAKRFALAAAVGVVADEDDDGNAAATQPTRTAVPAAAPKRTAVTHVDGRPITATVEAIEDAWKKLNAVAKGRAAELFADKFGDAKLGTLDDGDRAWLLAALVHEEVSVRGKAA